LCDCVDQMPICFDWSPWPGTMSERPADAYTLIPVFLGGRYIGNGRVRQGFRVER